MRAMHSRRILHLISLVGLGLLARAALFNHVGVFGDFGFWAYDSRLVIQGQTPFVDFPGRSPLMVYLLAVVRDYLGMAPVTLRATVIALWTLTAIPVYALARQLHSHTAGLVALAAFLLAPYPVVYGMWLNSQSLAALLATTALAAIVYTQTTRVYALAGSLLGLAYLSRRSVIVVAAAIGVWTLYHQTKPAGDYAAAARAIAARTAAAGLGWTLALAVGYLGVANADIGLAAAIARIDFIGLFVSGGRGAYPMVGYAPPPPQPTATGSGLFDTLARYCTACTAWAALRALKMLILGLPVLGLGAYYARDIINRYYTASSRQYIGAAALALAAYALVSAVHVGYYYRALSILALALFGSAAYASPRLPRRLLYSRPAQLIIATIAIGLLGYIVRERRILVYYMMDIWPYYAVLAGSVATAAWQRSERPGRVLLATAVVLATVSAVFTAAPLVDVALHDPPNNNWVTLPALTTHADHMTARANTPGGPGDTRDEVLSPNPVYVAGSTAHLAYNSSRLYMTTVLFANSTVGQRAHDRLATALQTGRIQLVVMTGLTRDIIARDPRHGTRLHEYYCRVPSPGQLYAHTNASLYQYQPTDCPPARRWSAQP